MEHEVLRDLGWLDDGSERGDDQPPLTDDSGAPCMSVCYGPDTKPVCCKSKGKSGGKSGGESGGESVGESVGESGETG